ncbi:MAG TPA: uroporphyrinogen-III C-methyltransferase [Crenotrichaceae bacterium]|nr:uroporphyrinogen-III C-methyltransferase [Crenotrichaceae bacterium]
MDFFPVFLRVAERQCLVVGGGHIAYRKVQLLLKSNAAIVVVAPEICASLQQLADDKRIKIVQKAFEESDVNNASLIIAATSLSPVNAKVAEAASQLNIPVNVVDTPDLSSFIFPAIVERPPLTIAVSSGGSSPVLVRILRERLETLIPARFGTLAEFAARFRSHIKQRVGDATRRRHLWEQILYGPVAELVFTGQQLEAERQLQQLVDSVDQGAQISGSVALVGAGPGDPELLTLRALRLIQQADVVVYDRLVSTEIMELVRRDAEKIYAGKARSQHSMSQETINQLLVRLAKQGKQVVRLKGGDPFIFGRGGEEIETLAEEGVCFQVVPGITAASGCAAYAGIPLTHRDYAQSCVFITGHLQQDNINLGWEHLNVANQTIVVYMGLVGLPAICQRIIESGNKADTPAALIEHGTHQDQRVITGTLKTLPENVAHAQVSAPTLLIIGDVVRLRNKLAWFQQISPISSSADD